MRFMLSGYGTGSKDGDGTAKQYRTLRGSLNIDSAPITFEKSGIRPSIRFSGETKKVNNEAIDNKVELLFHGLTEDDALNIASSFAEYALFLRRLRDSEKKTLALKESGERFAGSALQVLIESCRDEGLLTFFHRLKEYWLKESAQKRGLAEALKVAAALMSKDYSSTVKPMLNASNWQKASAEALTSLLDSFADDNVQDRSVVKPRLTVAYSVDGPIAT